MGEFNSGVWIIALSIYFIALFIVVNAVVNFSIEYDVDHDGVYATDTGFFQNNQEGQASQYENITLDSGTSANMNTIFESIKFLTGFGTDTIGLGTPTAYNWIFSFIFFYIPLLMLIWAIYMALPVIH